MNELLECGHEAREYGVDADGARHCYACCADRDSAAMTETGCASLYLVKDGGRWRVSNWPGSLVFPAWGYTKSRGVTPRGATFPIESARFHGPDGHVWSIVVRGDMQLGRARRLKERSRA